MAFLLSKGTKFSNIKTTLKKTKLLNWDYTPTLETISSKKKTCQCFCHAHDYVLCWSNKDIFRSENTF